MLTQLTASDATLRSLLLRHLLQSGATIEQRAVALRLLHVLLAPHLDFMGCDAAQPAGNSSSNNSSSSNSGSNHADIARVDALDKTQNQAEPAEPRADQQDGISPTEPSTLDSSSAKSQQLRFNLFKMLLEALPFVIKSAACKPAEVAEQASDSPTQAAQTGAQQGQDLESQTFKVQGSVEDQVVDGNAMHALLALVLHVATDHGLQGVLAVLAFPTALDAIMPELLVTPLVRTFATASSSLFYQH